MYITEAIRKDFTIVVANNEVVKTLKRLYKYDDIVSYRALSKLDGACSPLWIDHNVPIDKMDMDKIEANTFGQVFYGNSNDNEATDILNNCEDVINGQMRAVTSAIELRIFSSYLQKFLQDLERSNPELELTDTINQLVKLHSKFDKDAMEYGPYAKEEYINAVLAPHFAQGNSDSQ